MNPFKTTVNINTILRSGPDISRIISHSNSLLKLQSIIRANINPPECDHIYLASVSQDTAILYTDSPAWASKLRFRTQQLLDIIRKYSEYPDINTIRIKVSPGLFKPEDHETDGKLSPKTTKFLEEIANNIEDPDLKSALIRLSRNR